MTNQWVKKKVFAKLLFAIEICVIMDCFNPQADTAAAARLSTSTVGARKMSMDSVGILKQGASPCEAGRHRGLLGINHLKLSGSRKCVSFCQRDNVKVC